jgi:hypothetical protein
MPWFGVRSLYQFGTKADGTTIFEERIVVFEAETSDEALNRGADEAERYAEENGFEVLSKWDGYEQDGDSLIDGYEVWSQLFEARMSLEEFYATRYARFDYNPDPRLSLVK